MKDLHRFIDRYLTRKELRYRLEKDEDPSLLWPMIQEARTLASISIPLPDIEGKDFWYVGNVEIESAIRSVDRCCAQYRRILETVQEPGLERILFSLEPEDALRAEAYASSLIEGAVTSKRRAWEVLSRKTAPKNRSDRMIFNHHAVLRRVLHQGSSPIDAESIFEIARALLDGTCEDESDENVQGWRNGPVYVVESLTGERVHEPPPSSDLDRLMSGWISFARHDAWAFHPIIAASILHFTFVYYHPFMDGNGRTARVLSFLHLLQREFEEVQYFSLSEMIQIRRSDYYAALAEVEASGSDMTYFIRFLSDLLAESFRRMLRRLAAAAIQIEARRTISSSPLLSTGTPRSLRKTLELLCDWTLEDLGRESCQMDPKGVEPSRIAKKLRVSTEIVRLALVRLVDSGVVECMRVGRKHTYRFRSEWLRESIGIEPR